MGCMGLRILGSGSLSLHLTRLDPKAPARKTVLARQLDRAEPVIAKSGGRKSSLFSATRVDYGYYSQSENRRRPCPSS